MSVQVGQEAPDFTLKDTETQDVALSSFRGQKNVVLLFVPFAFTGVCTNELCSVRDNLGTYGQLDAEVLGISVDSPFAQKQWKEKENLNFTLVSDFNRGVSKAYGAQFDDLMGFSGVAKRAAFVIDKAGKVQYAEVLESPQGPAELRQDSGNAAGIVVADRPEDLTRLERKPHVMPGPLAAASPRPHCRSRPA